jgi:hypothetical protein
VHVQDVLPRDAIPSIDDPSFGADYFGDPSDEVIVVDASPPRAYPIRILSSHEIVNDVLDPADGEGRPIAVTWCPICASAVVYDRRGGGRRLTFGTSGKLADDALVMYDRETESEWKQPLGESIVGPLVGQSLSVVPASVTTYESFRGTSPDGVVLQPVRAAAAYDMTGYDRYDAAPGFGLREMRGEGPERTWDRADIGAKTTVLGVVVGSDAVGYPLPEVDDAGGVVADTVGGQDIVVVVASDTMQAFEDPVFDLNRRDGVLSGDGTAWDPASGHGAGGRRLEVVPSRRLYAFAWQDDHGPGSFYGLE